MNLFCTLEQLSKSIAIVLFVKNDILNSYTEIYFYFFLLNSENLDE